MSIEHDITVWRACQFGYLTVMRWQLTAHSIHAVDTNFPPVIQTLTLASFHNRMHIVMFLVPHPPMCPFLLTLSEKHRVDAGWSISNRLSFHSMKSTQHWENVPLRLCFIFMSSHHVVSADSSLHIDGINLLLNHTLKGVLLLYLTKAWRPGRSLMLNELITIFLKPVVLYDIRHYQEVAMAAKNTKVVAVKQWLTGIQVKHAWSFSSGTKKVPEA